MVALKAPGSDDPRRTQSVSLAKEFLDIAKKLSAPEANNEDAAGEVAAVAVEAEESEKEKEKEPQDDEDPVEEKEKGEHEEAPKDTEVAAEVEEEKTKETGAAG